MACVRIVMTGGSNGIGLDAVRRIVAAEPACRVLVGARGGRGAMPDAVEVVPLDLASLDSVSDFAAAVLELLDGATVDVLVLNAGIGGSGGLQHSTDGFELVFAVNHLAHIHLARLLLPAMSPGGRIVITASDTHDPEVISFAKGPVSLSRPELDEMARGSPARSGVRAYSASKAFNIMTARYLAEQEQAALDNNLSVVAYNPGFTPGTGLGGGSSSSVARFLIRRISRVVGWFNPALKPNDIPSTGQALADLVLGRVEPPEGRFYASMVRGELAFPDPSALARDDAACALLWEASGRMIEEGPPPVAAASSEAAPPDSRCVVQ